MLHCYVSSCCIGCLLPRDPAHVTCLSLLTVNAEAGPCRHFADCPCCGCTPADILGHYSGPLRLLEGDIILTEKKVQIACAAASLPSLDSRSGTGNTTATLCVMTAAKHLCRHHVTHMAQALFCLVHVSAAAALQVNFSMGADNPMDKVHFFKDFDSDEKYRITGRNENSMMPSHFQVPLPA